MKVNKSLFSMYGIPLFSMYGITNYMKIFKNNKDAIREPFELDELEVQIVYRNFLESIIFYKIPTIKKLEQILVENKNYNTILSYQPSNDFYHLRELEIDDRKFFRIVLTYFPKETKFIKQRIIK